MRFHRERGALYTRNLRIVRVQRRAPRARYITLYAATGVNIESIDVSATPAYYQSRDNAVDPRAPREETVARMARPTNLSKAK